MITFTGSLWLWNAEKGSWHFITVPPDAAAQIRLEGLAGSGGFGSVRVEAAIGEVRWRTSLFPLKGSGAYLLPVKAVVRRRAGVAANDEETVTLQPICSAGKSS